MTIIKAYWDSKIIELKERYHVPKGNIYIVEK